MYIRLHLANAAMRPKTYCRARAVRRLQVDSPQLRHTASRGKYIDRSYSRTDDSHMLRKQTQHISVSTFCEQRYIYRVVQKVALFCVRRITLSVINRFSKLFHCQNEDKICNINITKYPITTSQVFAKH